MSSHSDARAIAGLLFGLAGLTGLPVAWFVSRLSTAKWGTGNGVGVLLLSVLALAVAAVLLTPWAAVRRQADREGALWRAAHNDD